jgi:site-specific DNA-methyltransferase (adenine-specific)
VTTPVHDLGDDLPLSHGGSTWDVREGEALQALLELPPGSIDAVITDPPYNSGGTSSRERMEQAPSTKYVTTGAPVAGPEFPGDNRDQRSFTYWETLWLSAARRAARPGAVAVVCTDLRQLPATTDAIQAAGWVWRGVTIWAKPAQNARPRKGAFRSQAEYMVWATNGSLKADADAPCLPGVIEAASPRKSQRYHITQKPLDLMEVLVQVARPGELILDPFAGSGTTGVAAIKTGRRFLGIELLPLYAAIARNRISEAAKLHTQSGENGAQLPR